MVVQILLHKMFPGKYEKAEEYRLRFGRFRTMFQKVFYVHNESGWFDYNWRTRQYNFNFYPSVAIPLFTRCYHTMNHAQVEGIFQKMDKMGAFKYTGGVPASLISDTGNQWDYPVSFKEGGHVIHVVQNGWAPLNLMVIQGLRQSESSKFV